MESDDTEGTTAQEEGRPLELPSSVEMTREILKHSRAATGTPRQITNAALIGAALLFLATFLGLPRLDDSLQVAVIAFALAIPPLVSGTIFESFDVEPYKGPGRNGWLVVAQTARVLEVVGYLGVYVGVVATVGHLSHVAGLILALAVPGIIAAMLVLALPVGLVMAWQAGAFKQTGKQKARKEKKLPKPQQSRRR